MTSPMVIVLLYSGPDQILPMLSIVGAVIGFLLMWWRRLVALARRAWNKTFKKSPPLAKKPADAGVSRAIADDESQERPQEQPQEQEA